MSHKLLSRRTLLRGVLGGATVALALPTLDAMLPSQAKAAPLPPIFGIFYWANGMPWHDGHGAEQAGHPDLWTPAATGPGYAPSELLAPLADYQPSVITGLTPYTVIPPEPPGQGDGHMRGFMVAMTGASMRPAGFDQPNHILTAQRPTLDQLVAKDPAFYAEQPAAYGSLVLGVSTARFHDFGHWNAISYNGPDSLNQPILDPMQLFNMLFAVPTDVDLLARRASLLDAVKEDAKSLKVRLGAADRARIDAHLDHIGEIQKRLVLTGVACEAPGAPVATEDLVAKTEIMSELLAKALACGVTRVFSFMLTSPATTHVFSNLGVANDMHSTCHAGDWNAVHAITLYQMQAFAAFLGKLAAATDATGQSVLDRSIVFGTSEYGEGYKHSDAEMACILAGGGNGKLKKGVHVRAPGDNFSKAHVTMLRAAGLPTPTFGFDGAETSDAFGEIMVPG